MVTTLLVQALGVLVKLESVDSAVNLEEMIILCRELLACDDSDMCLTVAISEFAGAVSGLRQLEKRPSDQVIEFLRDANVRLPDSHRVSFGLSYALFIRFNLTYSTGDYDDATAILNKIISSQSPADGPDPYIPRAFCLLLMFANSRYSLHGNPEDLEAALSRCRLFQPKLSVGDPLHLHLAKMTDMFERGRFDIFGVANDSRHMHSRIPEPVKMPSFSDLASSLATSKTVKSQSTAIKYCRLLLASIPLTDHVAHIAASKLGDLLRLWFRCTGNIEHLNASITVRRTALKMPGTEWGRYFTLRHLITSLNSRLGLTGDRRDLDEIMQLFPITVTETYSNVAGRFEVACVWASTARVSGHPSTSTAYENAFSLMQESLTFAPTLETQHFRLVAMRDHYEKLPLDYASYLIEKGQLERAIETLERGRGLLWSEMRAFRTAVDQLGAVDSSLAERFAAVNRDLEALTKSGPPDVWSDDGRPEGDDAMDPFGHLITNQRRLLEERDGLISQIQDIPGYENFTTAPPFRTLRSAAVHGPVVIINHCHWRSDIIILLHDSPPSLIPTSHSFYDRAKALRDRLFVARREGLDLVEYENALSSVLQNLYDLVGRPVIKRLQELGVPEQSRIWWCPTSVFCSLPLHAMGPIRTEDQFKLHFSDLYIPSYTPALSTLIESHNPNSRSHETPSILLVAQPDGSMPGARQEISHIRRLDTKKATPSTVLKALQDHRFAHFSCHGILEPGKPFDASFKLYQGERLTLLNIVRSRLPSAEFAFLSACHTAEVTTESIADEALHLSAAVQYCGFRSVVGTMWAMADVDGHALAREFYAAVFSDRREGIPHYERTAEALRDAVKELRRKKKVRYEFDLELGATACAWWASNTWKV
ncbi:CHAT domain-containing protein [Russula earlei]|uniref:CHAT domain-containing protein n=1 Tax=Russula earlei TaxID=71964 RepID=A0ACC0U7A0_9AGAM|nr:CHAT domain-containing protein [Russula earlei]